MYHFDCSCRYFSDEDQTVDAALTAMFTHRESTARDGAAFFARVAHRVVHDGRSPREAIDEVAALPTTSVFVRSKVAIAIKKVEEARDPSSALSKEKYRDDLALTSMARLWDVGRT
jgi:ADP-ribosylglycohydrolase